MIWIIITVLILACLFLPGVWVKHVLTKYSRPEDRYKSSGTGAELARHLLDRLNMSDVGVEPTEIGDHYDPEARMVRLTPDKFHGCSLTAVTVAAHEVGHAIQDADGEKLFATRQYLTKLAMSGQKVGSALLLAAPIVFMLTRIPHAGLLMGLIGFATMGLASVVHLVTLPVEIDASFNKALPILESGEYLYEDDLPHARRILRAAALTYVAGSLASLLNLGRWLTILRR